MFRIKWVFVHIPTSHGIKYSRSSFFAFLFLPSSSSKWQKFISSSHKVKSTLRKSDKKERENFYVRSRKYRRKSHIVIRGVIYDSIEYIYEKSSKEASARLLVVSFCGRTKRKWDRRPWRAFAPNLCSRFRKLLTQPLIAHSGKAPFFFSSYLAGEHLMDCFLREALPRRWETCKTWQSPRSRCSASRYENIRVTRRTFTTRVM